MANWRIGKPDDQCACPKCGSPSVALWNDTGMDHFWMECNDCETHGGVGTAYGAVREWRIE